MSPFVPSSRRGADAALRYAAEASSRRRGGSRRSECRRRPHGLRRLPCSWGDRNEGEARVQRVCPHGSAAAFSTRRVGCALELTPGSPESVALAESVSLDESVPVEESVADAPSVAFEASPADESPGPASTAGAGGFASSPAQATREDAAPKRGEGEESRTRGTEGVEEGGKGSHAAYACQNYRGVRVVCS